MKEKDLGKSTGDRPNIGEYSTILETTDGRHFDRLAFLEFQSFIFIALLTVGNLVIKLRMSTSQSGSSAN